MKHSFFSILQTTALAFIVAAAALPASAQEKAVVVLAKDGSRYELALSQVQRINFNPTQVDVVSKSGSSKAMSYADVDRILIGSELSGITEVISEGEIAVWPTLTTGTFNIYGAAEGTPVAVFDSAGTMIYSAAAAGGNMTVDVPNARQGLLIVRIGNQSVKLIKK